MKNITFLIITILLGGKLFAQTQSPPRAKPTDPPPLPFREVSGIVKDSSDNSIPGVTITLISKKDTLHVSSNERGIFVFKNVKQATFSISFKAMGFAPTVRKFLLSDLDRKLVLNPIILGQGQHVLNEVKINGTPDVIYKTDTVEYRAANYKVRPDATLDELLKKMPNVEVDKNGKVTFMGEEVKKARLNGKDFAGGDVAQAVKNLPAAIVDKAQFVDDYGQQAARTGIKDGDPTKVLNITTKADRSIGNMARLSASAGNNDRSDGNAFVQRINANQQIGFNGSFNSTVNGVAGDNSSGASGGSNSYGRPSMGYRDQWGKKVQFNSSYSYNFYNSNNIYDADGQSFSSNGTTNFVSSSSGESGSKGHNLYMQLDINADSSNFIQITPTFNYSGSNSSNTYSNTLFGYQNQIANGTSLSSSDYANYGGTAFYQHLFKKKKRNFSAQFSANWSTQKQRSESNTRTLYQDSLLATKRDSIYRPITARNSPSNSYSTNLTYVEPLSKTELLQFNAVLNYRGYANTAVTDSINRANQIVHVPSLSSIYNYSFSETRLGVNYTVNKPKYNYSLGVTAIPTLLEGTQVTLNATTSRTNFTIIPIFRFQYVFSKTHRLSMNYNGSPTEPTFSQIQPVADKSSPQNVIVGNPDLRPSFRHTVSLQYNNYIPNSKLTLSATANTSMVNSQVVSNVLQVPLPAISSFYNETHYLNLNGAYSVSGNYGITKQLSDQKYSLRLNGTMSYNHNISMSNDIGYHADNWRFSEVLGPQLNPTEAIEINPSVSYTLARSFFTQPNARNTDTKTTALTIDGVFTYKKWKLGYNASKNYVEGISANLTHNPFVVDAYLQRTLFPKIQGNLKIQAFDIFNQNNFINQTVSTTSITNTKSNVLSRYVYISFSVFLQKWSGSPKRNGAPMMRRGDGSFVY
ncbi:MAG: TonB-dependent receptor [Mucilaginibacter sp.]|uniref:TonB-dependent receptor n=1 Tax=Mucilaginibacter sp. TaxID=1882438 RepID=UPI00326505C6